MKRLVVILLLVAASAIGQETTTTNARQFKTKIFEIKNQDPRAILESVARLGSGVPGTGMSVNAQLRTITIRDFPEDVAQVEEAIQRLDRPAAETPDVQFKISVLIGSKSPLSAASVPDELEAVVKQLQSTLRYAHYGLMTAVVQRTKVGGTVEGSGIAEPSLLGMTPNQERPIFYNYKLLRVTAREGSVNIDNFEFGMRVPVVMKGGLDVQYQNVGFQTPVSLRDSEKVVIGTTTMGDKALIVVVTATAGSK